MPYARTSDDIRLSYEVHGSGEDHLVLLAGQAATGRMWSQVRPDFDAAFRTITFDYRGTGASDKPDSDTYSTRGFARDVVAILDHLGVEHAHAYGISMGGRAAQWLAADHPERVDRLVLGCTTPGNRHGVARGDDVVRGLTQRDPDAAQRYLLELLYTPAYLAANPLPQHTLSDPAMPTYARERHRVASDEHDAWEALPMIAAPTLVVHGADDIFNPAANAPLLAERIPNARLERIRAARHAYFEEFRSVASPLVVDFLRGHTT